MADSVPPQELKVLLDSDQKPVLLDVRRKVDFEAEPRKIGGASWFDPEKVDEWSVKIPQDRPVVAYCVKGGSVSQSIADRLKQSHPNIKFLEGGLKAWVDLGETVE